MLFSYLSLFFSDYERESFFVYQISKLTELFLRNLPSEKALGRNVLECIRNIADILHQNPITDEVKCKELLSFYELLRQQKQVVKKALDIVSKGEKLGKLISNSKNSKPSILTVNENEMQELDAWLQDMMPSISEKEELSAEVKDAINKKEWKVEWLKEFQGQKKKEKMKKAVLKCMIKYQFSAENLETKLSTVDSNLKKAANDILAEVNNESKLNNRGKRM